MINKMYRVLTIFCIALALPILVSAQPGGGDPRSQEPKPLGNTIAPPLATSIKLNAINKLRQELKMPPLPPASSPPPAKVILTPAVPTIGKNSISVVGSYNNWHGTPRIRLRFQDAAHPGQHDILDLRFVTIPGKTYLLDIFTGGTHTWINKYQSC